MEILLIVIPIFVSLSGLNETCLRKDDENESNSEIEETSEERVNENNSSYGDLLLQKLKSCLAGVPPPPQLTYPQHKVEDMLDVLKSDDWIKSESNRTGFYHQKVNCNQSVGATRTWPAVKDCIFFDISYNVNNSTEKLVELCDAYRQRYVGCETSSFVTANSPSKYNGKKKDRRKITGRSPRRLSYLTQRRKIFSSNSLKEASKTNSFGLAKKTILISGKANKKSSSQLETKRALFLTSEEQRSLRLETLKRSPGKAKSLWMQRNLPNRSTPRKRTPKKSGTSSQYTPRKSYTPRKNGTPRKQGTPQKRTPRKSEDYRNLNENGKRNRSVMESGDDLLSLPVRMDNCRTKANTSSELSDTQRRKLLWAVSSALGKVGVKQDHSNFRSYGKRLFRVCKQMWTKCSMNTTLSHGVSEQMLSMASEHLTSVMKEVDEEKIVGNPDLFSQDSNSCDFFSNNPS